MKLAKEHGYTFIHPFNDENVAAGQGTIAMEIVKELPTVDYILVSDRRRRPRLRCINTCKAIKS